MEKIIILGNGGHARSIADVIERQGEYEIAGYVVNEDGITDADYPVIGCDDDLNGIFQNGICNAAVGIGFLGKSMVRNKLYNRLKEIGFSLPVLCDSSAVVSTKSLIQEGTFIGKGAVVNAGTKIGKMCIINTNAVVEHDCKVGDFSHIAVGAVICGNVQVGRNVLIGANATILQGREVGDCSIVGAGEVMRKNVGEMEVFCKNTVNKNGGGEKE